MKWIWYLSPMRAAKVQASLRIRAVSPEPSLLAHTSSESRGTLRQKARSLAPLNGWACAVKICHDGMLEDTNSLDGAQLQLNIMKHPNCLSVAPVVMLSYVSVMVTTTSPTDMSFRGNMRLSTGIWYVFGVVRVFRSVSIFHYWNVFSVCWPAEGRSESWRLIMK